ncbi:hypothetical protein SNE40_019387 [Patella caerulea]|uniref:Uncharacterized protein n=1 Tax=Patella caerulea TaxID=87958 RepID=A0AAN8PFG3_PATCE
MAEKTSTMSNGGFWNAPKANYSPQTQNLLKEMMNESKLTNFQQRHLEKSLRGGSSLPVQCAPTSSARPKIQKIPQKQSKIINPKTYKGGVRTKNTMEAQGAFEKPEYILPHKVTRSTREKEKLANIMAFGEDVDKSKKVKVKRVELPEEDEVEIDRFDELKCEVEDRQNFLTDMIKLGRGKEFKTVIDTEISQLVREMELIDKKRTKELEVLIQKKERENNKLNDS